MMQTTSRIIKSGDAEVEGQFQLDLDRPAQTGQKPVGAPKVRIIENQNEIAVVEVICSCGRKTVVRCEYGESAALKTVQPRPDAGLAPEKKT